MKLKSATKGLYGPENPPPPPPGTPPNDSRRDFADEDMSAYGKARNRPGPDKRRRTYAAAEAKESYTRDSERFRSRSPARLQDRYPNQHYRERFPLRDEETTDWSTSRSQVRQPTFHKDDGMRCYACNETGHKAIDCKGAAGGHSSYGVRACFRCGELDHIARECTVRVGQIKTDVEVAASNNRHLQQFIKADHRRSWSLVREKSAVCDWEKGMRGDRWVPPQEKWDDHNRNETLGGFRQAFRSPYATGASRERFGQYRNARGDAGRRSSGAPTSSARAVEDEVDWDDDALDAGDASSSRKNTISRNAQRASQSNVPRQPQGPELYPPYGDRRRQSMTGENAPWKQMKQDQGEGDRAQEFHPKTTMKNPRPPHDEGVSAPATTYNLRGYNYQIYTRYAHLPKSERFVNGDNGKVAPARYGSEQRHDLGLCFTTFLTKYRCEMGLHCPWRHHPLSAAERAWIVEYGKHRGEEFLDNVDRWWACPEMPVPGATMHGLGDD